MDNENVDLNWQELDTGYLVVHSKLVEYSDRRATEVELLLVSCFQPEGSLRHLPLVAVLCSEYLRRHPQTTLSLMNPQLQNRWS